MDFTLKRVYNKFNSLFQKKTKPVVNEPYRVGDNTLIEHCQISSHTSIGRNCYLHKTTLGAYTYLSSDISIMNTSAGKFCSIGQGVRICTGMHPSSIFVSTHPAFFSLHKQCGITFAKETHFREMGKTHIGNDVWIGTNAVIMDDINIGDGAIIGAGAIVTKHVPPYAIIIGNPGKILRFRFSEEEINFLLNFKWWEKDSVWIAENYARFHNIKSFIQDFS